MTDISVTAFIQIANIVSYSSSCIQYIEYVQINRQSLSGKYREWMSWNILLQFCGTGEKLRLMPTYFITYRNLHTY